MSLRDRKKDATRRALVAAAAQLFVEQGYAKTTVAEIAAGAGVSTKTLFNYFTSKDDLLLADEEQRLDTALEVIASRGPDEKPADLLERLSADLVASFAVPTAARDDATGIGYELRLQLVLTVPEVRARTLQQLQDAQLRLVAALHEAYPPPQLDPITAAGTIGALIGAAHTARLVSMQRGDSPDEVLAATQHAVDIAMHGIRTAIGSTG